MARLGPGPGLVPGRAGLSELTFDARPPIRKSALEVLFDILRVHGHIFSEAFWGRVFDSVLLPIFDHVRSGEMFAGDGQDEIDAWLYETCTHCLRFVVDLFAQFYQVARFAGPHPPTSSVRDTSAFSNVGNPPLPGYLVSGHCMHGCCAAVLKGGRTKAAQAAGVSTGNPNRIGCILRCSLLKRRTCGVAPTCMVSLPPQH